MWVRSRATPRLRAKASAAVAVGGRVGSFSQIISSCSRWSSACSSASVSPLFAARTSSAKSRMAASACGQAGVAQEQARRKSLERAAHDAIGILRLDLAFDLDAQLRERAVGGEDMGEVAEGVLVGIEPRVAGNVDAPADDILAFMVARGEPQHLDHAGGRRLVAMDDAVGDAQAHVRRSVISGRIRICEQIR